MPAGRPTDYRPEFCQKMQDALAEGWSMAAAAWQLGVSERTAYTWMELHPEFLQAVTLGKSGQSFYWEGISRTAQTPTEQRKAEFMLERMHRKQFGARQELTGKDGGPLELLVGDMSDADLLNAAAAIVVGAGTGNLGGSGETGPDSEADATATAC